MIDPCKKDEGLLKRRHGDCPDDEMSNSRAAQWQSKEGDMFALVFTPQKAQTDIRACEPGKRAIERAQMVGAVVGLFGSVASAMFGAVFTVAGWLAKNEGARQWLSTTGTVLFFMTIPLLIISGYCMDWLEKDRPQRNSKVVSYEDDDEER
jgi:hypothetical protein